MMVSFERPREGVTIPRIWIAILLSILLHAAAFYRAMPKLQHHMTMEEPEQGKNAGALAVRIAPSPSRAQPPTPPPSPPPRAVPPPQPKAARPAPAAPPVIALNNPSASPAPSAPAVPAPPAAPSRPPVAGDFMADLEARRRANAASAPSAAPGMIASAPAETEAERARRITSANLAQKPMVFGYDPAAGGGVFQIRRMSISDGEFVFYGWNREIKRKTMQIIEVSKGNNPDIRIAMVRKMIAIIRDDVKDEFNWESKLVGRNILLSARPRDNAFLEDFMMKEFFPDQVIAR